MPIYTTSRCKFAGLAAPLPDIAHTQSRPRDQLIAAADAWLDQVHFLPDSLRGHSSTFEAALREVLHDPLRVAAASSAYWSIITRLLALRGLHTEINTFNSLLLETRRSLTPAEMAEASKQRIAADETNRSVIRTNPSQMSYIYEKHDLASALVADLAKLLHSLIQRLRQRMEVATAETARLRSTGESLGVTQSEEQMQRLSHCIAQLEFAVRRIKHRSLWLGGRLEVHYGPGHDVDMDRISTVPLEEQIRDAIDHLSRFNNPAYQLVRTKTFAVREAMELREASALLALSGAYECYSIDIRNISSTVASEPTPAAAEPAAQNSRSSCSSDSGSSSTDNSPCSRRRRATCTQPTKRSRRNHVPTSKSHESACGIGFGFGRAVHAVQTRNSKVRLAPVASSHQFPNPESCGRHCTGCHNRECSAIKRCWALPSEGVLQKIKQFEFPAPIPVSPVHRGTTPLGALNIMEAATSVTLSLGGQLSTPFTDRQTETANTMRRHRSRSRGSLGAATVPACLGLPWLEKLSATVHCAAPSA